MKVDITKFEKDTWGKKWYVCPNCEFDSLDSIFERCPICGIKLEWPDDFVFERCPICGRVM